MRTSQGTFISRRDDPDGVLAWIEDKIAMLAGIHQGHGEVRHRVRPSGSGAGFRCFQDGWRALMEH